MRDGWIFFLCLLLACDAAPVVLLFFPLGGGINIRLIRRIFRVGALLRRISVARRLLRLAPIVMRHRQQHGGGLLMLRGSCHGTLDCGAHHTIGNVKKDDDNGLKITLYF